MCADNIVYIFYIIDIEEGLKYQNNYFLNTGQKKNKDRYVRQWFKENYRKPISGKGQCCKSFDQYW